MLLNGSVDFANEELAIGEDIVAMLEKHGPSNQGTALEKNSGPNFASQSIYWSSPFTLWVSHDSRPHDPSTSRSYSLTICAGACPQQPHSPEKVFF